ncbi:MAG: CARDB domain-containing protein, partial [Nitrospirota bacterium]
MKRIIFFFLLICIFIGRGSTSAQDSPKDKGLLWLLNNQDPAGFWGNSIRTPFRDTCTVIDTLSYLKATDSTNYSSGIQWIINSDVTNIDSLSRKIFSLSIAGIIVQQDVDNLVALQNTNSGWGLYYGNKSDPLTTALALQALKAANYPDQTVTQTAIDYLLSTQNTDGGWGFYPSPCSGCEGDESNVYMTALVWQSLIAYDSIFNIQDSKSKAVAYLMTKQNPDGGFGYPASTIYETALTVISLIESGQGSALPLQDAINYLLSNQSPDGSWLQDPYSTAFALRALADVKPNLSIALSDIVFSNPTPTQGDTVTITATIHNNGPAQADNVLIHFFDGDPSTGGILIGETTITSIAAFGVEQASITYTIPTASSKTIFVKIDPLNVIDELDETDNIASKNLTSSTLPDLSITSADIEIFPPCPDPYIMVGISVKVRNHGETDASNVLVEVYDGDPSAGGVKLPGGGIIPTIPAGGFADVTAAIAGENVTGLSKDIYVLVDPQNTISESNGTNNQAVKTFLIGASLDLSVSSENISFNPSNPREGDSVEVSARVNNTGYGQPKNVLVRFYLGDPKAGGTKIGSDITIPSIGSNGSVTVTTQWNTTGHIGNNDIYVWIDPDDTIEEEYEGAAAIWGLDVTNNIAYKTLKVATSQGPDLTLTSSDITFSPQTPLKGDIVTITATIRNTGNQDASNVPVEFSIYDIAIGASLILETQTISFIPVGGSIPIQIQWETNIFSGDYDIHVEIDKSNIVFELDEANNEAQKPITITPPQGPDIVIFSIDKTGVISDPQTRTISGNVNITIKNIGNQNTVSPFVITAFEDRNNNLTFDPATDSILGQATYSGNLTPEMTAIVNIPVSGTVLYIDSPIYLFADSGNTITETDETNNIECLSIFTTCRNSRVDEAIKEGASWLIEHQLNVDQQGTMKAWPGTPALHNYNALAVRAYKSTGRTSGTKYADVLNKLIQMQAPDGSWDESLITTPQAILSLLYIGTSPDSASITDAVSWITRQQNNDGGWGYSKGSQSGSWQTGLALTALLKAGVNKNETFIQKAAQWLKNAQNWDGYWGDYPGVASNKWVDTYPVIGLALATSPSDSRVQAAKNWYYQSRNDSECIRLYWLRMILEIEPNHPDIMNVATSLQNLQMPDGGWRQHSIYSFSFFEITADTLYILGRLGFTGTRIDNGIQWIENHINPLGEGFHEQKSILSTDRALDALQAARIGDTANLNSITAGRNAIVNSQNSDGSWAYVIPVAYVPFIGATGDSIFALKYYQNVTPAEQSAATRGSNFLIGTQLSDGGWPQIHGQGVSELSSSETALLSLLQFGLTASNTTVSRGLSYLNSKQKPDGGFDNTGQTAQAAIIYKLAGSSYQSKLNQTISWLKANQNPDGGWGTMLGYTSTVGGTSLALIALSYAGESGIEVARGVSWLLEAQNEDKGWGQIMGVPVSYDSSTAMAVWALSLAKFSLGFNLDITVERENYCPNDIVRITVTADKPVQDISLNGSITLQEGASYPLTFNLSDNTFNAEFTVPSNALPGTATIQTVGIATYGYGIATKSFIIKNCSSLKPDLSISDSDIRAISEGPDNIDLKTIYATVRNNGVIDANNVIVHFYKNSISSENLIESEPISNIPASGSYTISTTIVLNEDTVIYVVVDPDNAIEEMDKSNNIALILLMRTIPDLSITQSDITIIPPDTIEGQPAVIKAIIHNIAPSTGSGLGASDVVVSFYDGDPQSGGTLIGSITKSYIDSGATALAEIQWDTFGQSGR